MNTQWILDVALLNSDSTSVGPNCLLAVDSNSLRGLREQLSMSFVGKRIVDAASRLIWLAGGTINYTKLLKLLYISDRESLRKNHTPITYDGYVSMNNGPVLSLTYNLIKGVNTCDEWTAAIEKDGYVVRLKSLPESDLSESDEEILDQVFADFRERDQWWLIDHVHTFPEWKFPDGTSIPIPLDEVLRGCGFENELADQISSEHRSHRQFLGIAS